MTHELHQHDAAHVSELLEAVRSTLADSLGRRLDLDAWRKVISPAFSEALRATTGDEWRQVLWARELIANTDAHRLPVRQHHIDAVAALLPAKVTERSGIATPAPPAIDGQVSLFGDDAA